jgi:hypothetical protein
MTEGGPAASQLENLRPALTMTRGKSTSWLRPIYWRTGYRDVDPNHKMLEGGPVQGREAMALALTNHDKGGSDCHGQAQCTAAGL